MEFAIGSQVRVLPDRHREGEEGTVVRVDPEVRANLDNPPPAGDVAVAFMDVSFPLFYGPDELEAV